jgi:hypothetical protein
MRREYVTNEQAKRLPHAGRIRIRFKTWWFARAWGDRKQPWRLQRTNFWMSTRGANYGQVWVGPFSIIWPARWLKGPARALHPEVFVNEVADEGVV